MDKFIVLIIVAILLFALLIGGVVYSNFYWKDKCVSSGSNFMYDYNSYNCYRIEGRTLIPQKIINGKYYDLQGGRR